MASETQAVRRPAGAGVPPGAIVAWIVCGLFVGLAADLMQPAGAFVLFLTVVFAIVAVVCALFSFVPPIRTLMRAAALFALVSLVLFGAFAAAQRFLAQPEARGRGVLAALVPGAEDLQRFLLAEAARREARGVEAAASSAPELLLRDRKSVV